MRAGETDAIRLPRPKRRAVALNERPALGRLGDLARAVDVVEEELPARTPWPRRRSTPVGHERTTPGLRQRRAAPRRSGRSAGRASQTTSHESTFVGRFMKAHGT